jgi:hypothetical protein
LQLDRLDEIDESIGRGGQPWHELRLIDLNFALMSHLDSLMCQKQIHHQEVQMN